MVESELWRYDSWSTPLLTDDLQLLRTDADTEVLVESGSCVQGSFAASCRSVLGTASSAASLKSGAQPLLRACGSLASTKINHEPVLRGAAGRTAVRGGSVAVPVLSALQHPTDSRSMLSGGSIAPSSELPPESLSVFGPELPFSWEDADLPMETAWMFDSSSEPPPAGLLDLYAPNETAGLGCSPVEPGSPVSVFHAACSPSESSGSGCASTCSEGDAVLSKGPQDLDTEGQSPDESGPECSADTTTTRLHGVDGAAFSSIDTAVGPLEVDSCLKPASALKREFFEGHEDKTTTDVDSQELNSRPSKKPRRAASSRSNIKASVTKSVSAQQPKKQKGRQSCVQCFTFSTPQWREGPQGARTLCNACGVRYRKQLNQAKKLKSK